MTQAARKSRNHWEVAVLAFLRERPMHPYEMQRLLRLRRKDELLALKRGSLYHAINRLARDGLITAIETSREGGRPERTTYQLTPAGERELLETLRAMVADPRGGSSEFFAGLSFLVYLTPDDAASQLAERLQRLDAGIEALTARCRGALQHAVERINILEEEYLLTMSRAERQWVAGVLEELRAGQLTWDLDAMLARAREAYGRGARPRGKEA
ncbi:MAG TPA: helix-turn-helix transcriptional regulator [Vicinamibacterales bacterium]